MNSTYLKPAISAKYRSAKRKQKWGQWAIILLLLAGSIGLGMLQIRTPNPVGAESSPQLFSAERAMEKVRVIAAEPHPVGSPAHDKVRDYLLSELKALGLQPEVQRADARTYRGDSVVVENIIARMPGTDNSKAVMIAAHYDSVAGGPGAADDGAGIAAMLETIRAIQASGALKNDLILLMTDGEELGLLGAEAFMREHPWAKDAAVVLNFEARGNKGPSFMFETSEGNGWLIKEFIKAAPQPLAYSLIYNVYKLMPNDTDMTVFREGGLAGLNFAFGIGLNAYHTTLDTPDNLDRSSLQHHGEYMLSLAKHFGGLNLDQTEQGDRVYFNAMGSKMISYPESWAVWLLVAVALLFVGTVRHGISKKRLTIKGIAGGFLLALLSLAVVFAIITGLWRLLELVVSDPYFERIVMDPQVSIYYLLGMLLVALLLTAVVVRLLSRYTSGASIWMGALVLWLLLSAGTTLYLPGGSYLFTWPLLFSLIGVNLYLQLRKDTSSWTSVLFSVPGFILLTPIVYIVYNMMTLMMSGALLTLAALGLTLIYPVFCSKKAIDKG